MVERWKAQIFRSRLVLVPVCPVRGNDDLALSTLDLVRVENQPATAQIIDHPDRPTMLLAQFFFDDPARPGQRECLVGPPAKKISLNSFPTSCQRGTSDLVSFIYCLCASANLATSSSSSSFISNKTGKR